MADIIGTDGNDYVYGSYEDDTLNGGAGNDYLAGQFGNDVYLFDMGDGQDIISDWGNNTIRFGTGITTSDIGFTRSGMNLVLSINGTSDRLTLPNWGYSSYYHFIDRVELFDGTVWDREYLESQILPALITGSDANDYLQAWSDMNETLVGLVGNDTLQGSNGDDILDGGSGNDLLAGGSGNDVYLFGLGSGQDVIGYDDGNLDIIRFGAGITAENVILARSEMNLVFNIAGTADQLTVLRWGEGGANRTIERVEFADGTAWDATFLQLNIPTSPMIGTENNDYIWSWRGVNEVLLGMNGDDYLFGNDSENVMDGGGGNDYLSGSAGNDLYLFGVGSGQDIISEYDETFGNIDTIRFGGGIKPDDINITQIGKNLVFSIKGTNDSLTLENWGDGNGPHSIEAAVFEDGTTWDVAYFLAKVPTLSTGTAAGETLQSWWGKEDVLQGLGGDDYLDAKDGNDILDGGEGNDWLSGGDGDDLYIFNLGSGQDTLFDYGYEMNTIRFGVGIAASDIVFTRSGEDLVLSISESDQLRLREWGDGWSAHDWNRSIGKVEFADGTVWDGNYLRTRIPEELIGTNAGDYLEAWKDTNNTVLGLGGDDTLIGSNGNDRLDGGSGYDWLIGAEGNDTYVFNLGGGKETIYEYDDTKGIDTISFGTGISSEDILVGYNGNDLVLTINGSEDSLTILSWGSGEEYRIEWVQYSDGTVWDAAVLLSHIPIVPIGTDAVETLQAWSGLNEVLLGMGGDDSLLGGSGNDIIQGGDGNDYLSGNKGNDLLDGNAGNDVLHGGISDDVFLFNRNDGIDVIQWEAWNGEYDSSYNFDAIRFGEGIDSGDITFSRNNLDLILSLSGTQDSITIENFGYDSSKRFPYSRGSYRWQNHPIDQIQFSDGTVWNIDEIQSRAFPGQYIGSDASDSIFLWSGEAAFVLGQGGDDYLAGNNGNDILDGGSGNDWLFGGEGNDVYLFDQGGGQDVISDWSGSLDILRFGAGIYASDITLTRSDMDLILNIAGTTDQITVAELGYSWASYGLERVEFADGTIWDASLIQSMIPTIDFLGTDAHDGWTGWAKVNDTMVGMAGDDGLEGGSGNNVLEGGVGNDSLNGGDGDDVYVFRRGDEQDRITDLGGVDTIRFGTGIVESDIRFIRRGQELVLGIAGSSDKLTIERFDRKTDRIERIEFENGTVWDGAYLQSLISSEPQGTEFHDLLYAWEGYNETLQGMGGSDYLDGSKGDDILIGSKGKDNLNGDEGNDIYVFNLGDGQDEISEELDTNDDVDTLRFGDGITESNLIFTVHERDLAIGMSGTFDQILIDGWAGWNGQASRSIERFEFADGTIWEAAEIQAHIPAISTLIGGKTNDFLHAWTVNSTLYGLQGDDQLYGSRGDDIVNGNEGDDLIRGGQGNDLLIGDEGSDTYLFSLGSDYDTIRDQNLTGKDINTVAIEEAITPDDIVVTRTNDALVLNVRGADDTLIIEWDPQARIGVQQVTFYDGTVWDAAMLEAMAIPVNQAPILANPISTQHGVESLPIVFQIPANAFIDSDAGDVLSYSITLADGSPLPSWLSLDAATGILSGTPSLIDAGILALSVTATDLRGLSASGNFDLDIANLIEGTAGNDTLLGTSGNDFILAFAGDDIVNGDAGDDIITGGVGSDILAGGDGNDTFLVDGSDSVSDSFAGDAGYDVIQGGNADDVITVNLFSGNYTVEKIDGGAGTNMVAGTLLNDTIDLSATELVNIGLIDAGNGNDIVIGSAGNDTIAGGAGSDILSGGDGNDVFLVAGSSNADDSFAGDAGYDVIQAGSGDDVITMSLYSGNYTVEQIDGGAGSNTIAGSQQGDILDFSATELVNIGQVDGGGGDDLVIGSSGNDNIDGGAGSNLIQGGAGADAITNTKGDGLLDGGAGNDALLGADKANELLIGGIGNDILTTGTGNDVIAFNKGDGADLVTASTGTDNTLSLGGGIEYADMSLSKTGNDLILKTGGADQITLKDWYALAKKGDNHSVLNLQVIAEAMADFAPGGADVLMDNKVEIFNFAGLVDRFDQALATTPLLTGWALTDALMDFHLTGSDAEAIGGDLAYQYGRTGILAGIGIGAAQSVINDPKFGGSPQTLSAPATWQAETVKLG